LKNANASLWLLHDREELEIQPIAQTRRDQAGCIIHEQSKLPGNKSVEKCYNQFAGLDISFHIARVNQSRKELQPLTTPCQRFCYP